MRRFRLIFLLVAVALVVPTALLARRALQSVEVERRARHETVAERLFDEMERALSGFLTNEEARPFGQYSSEYTPPGAPPSERVPSPLAASPALPFVLGYFQVDPDDSLRFVASPAAEVRRVVGGFWRSDRDDGKLALSMNIQEPGSTLELAQKSIPAEQKLSGRVSAYDALRSLNKGVEQRADRQMKVTREYAKEADVRASNERERFELSPMVGRLVADGRLMLYRTVVHEKQGYRQGMLLDLGALGEWLRGQSIGGSELSPYASVAFDTGSAAASRTTESLVYQHRFAEPFEAVSARVSLSPLPGVGGAGSIYALAIVSLAVVALGLAALYRMVSVVVRYAEQRQNFVAAVTHELKTPLTAIRMYGEMLRDGIVPSEAKRDEYHRNITAESERLTRLVNNVLELSRLEKKTRETRVSVGDLGAVAREAANLLRPHVEGAGFTLRVDVEDALPAARFERDAVLQMLFNLVDNAVKYATGAGPKEIELGCRRSGSAIALRVRDHGPGVASAHLKKIFEPFYRGENELTRRTKGTGLGLALVRGLADEMSARVSGRNLEGGGFEVEVLVPIAAG